MSLCVYIHVKIHVSMLHNFFFLYLVQCYQGLNFCKLSESHNLHNPNDTAQLLESFVFIVAWLPKL